VAGLKGLAPLGPYVQPASEQGELERSGLPADRRHGGPLLTGPGYPYQTGPYPSSPQGSYGPSGIEGDLGNWCVGADLPRADAPPGSRWTGEKGNHGGPFPAWAGTYGQSRDGETSARLQVDSMADHSADFGMGTQRQNVYGHDFQGAHFRQTYAESAGTTELDPRVPDQIKVTDGRDRVQGWKRGNAIFQTGHILRRDQADGVPYNTQWLGAVHRPMTIRRAGYKNTFDGPDSPYGTAGDESMDMMQTHGDGVSVQSDPTPYTPPADPTYGAVPAMASDAYADW
jgi:hypothetical protein